MLGALLWVHTARLYGVTGVRFAVLLQPLVVGHSQRWRSRTRKSRKFQIYFNWRPKCSTAVPRGSIAQFRGGLSCCAAHCIQVYFLSAVKAWWHVKVWTLAVAPLTWVRLVTSSALQSRGSGSWLGWAGLLQHKAIVRKPRFDSQPVGYKCFLYM